MPIFGMQDIDPLFDSMSKANQETVLSLAHGQASSFVPALQVASDEETASLKANGQSCTVQHDAEQLTDDEFNWAMSEAHPLVLRSLFVMGFCQGFCLRHRLMALDTHLYSFFAPVEDEDDEDLEGLADPDDDEEEGSEDNVGSSEGTDA